MSTNANRDNSHQLSSVTSPSKPAVWSATKIPATQHRHCKWGNWRRKSAREHNTSVWWEEIMNDHVYCIICKSVIAIGYKIKKSWLPSSSATVLKLILSLDLLLCCMHSLWFHRRQRCSTQVCLMFVLELRCAHQCWTLVGHVLRTSVCAVVIVWDTPPMEYEMWAESVTDIPFGVDRY